MAAFAPHTSHAVLIKRSGILPLGANATCRATNDATPFIKPDCKSESILVRYIAIHRILYICQLEETVYKLIGFEIYKKL
jgi:hypothetical protein